MTSVAEPSHAGPVPHEHEEHPPFLAHHFETPRQQFDSGKLGMWLFLVTEILFFSGLFAAYAVYRSNHPEIFVYAHQFLDKSLGAVNTAVLLLSSLTMAWAVRCSQLNQKRGLAACLTITLACASIFMGIKAVEYSHKWDEGLLWAGSFAPAHIEGEHGLPKSLMMLSIPATIATLLFAAATGLAKVRGSALHVAFFGALALSAACYFLGVGAGLGIPALQSALGGEHEAHADDASHGLEAEATQLAAAADEPTDGEHAGHEHAGDAHEAEHSDGESSASHAATGHGIEQPPGAGIFFSIYYCMTGLHAIHILAGMGAISWLLYRGLAGHFRPDYFGPVDYVGLYWHLVDLIWIYLFPLLYLIH